MLNDMVYTVYNACWHLLQSDGETTPVQCVTETETTTLCVQDRLHTYPHAPVFNFLPPLT